jgi:hypothetical protein
VREGPREEAAHGVEEAAAALMELRLRHPAAALLGALSATALVSLTGAGELVGGGVATACAQAPTVPTDAIPTVGPVDPACSRVPDTDNDSVFDYEDNCNGYFNPSQRDTDNDSGPPPYEPIDTKTNPRDPMTGGDTCDVDDDGDLVQDLEDNCQKAANKDQADADRDGIGDACDEETAVPEPERAAPQRQPAAPSAEGSAPSAAPGPAARPSLTVLRIKRRLRVGELRTGLAIPVRCSAACVVAGELVATDARTARRLKLRALGRGVARVDEAGMTFVFVRLSARTLARVRRAKASTATLRLTAADLQGGNRQTVTRRLTLTR